MSTSTGITDDSMVDPSVTDGSSNESNQHHKPNESRNDSLAKDNEEVIELTDEELRVANLRAKYPTPNWYDKRGRTPFDAANPVSSWTFSYMDALIYLGFRRPLSMEDVPKVPEELNINHVAPNLDNHWKRRVDEAARINAENDEKIKAAKDAGLPPPDVQKANPSIIGACMSYTMSNIIWMIIYQALVRADTICEPMILEKLLDWLVLDNPSDPTFVPQAEKWGYIWAVVLFIMAFASNLFNNRYFSLGFFNLSAIRAGLNSLIYTKSMKIGSMGEAQDHQNDKPKDGKKGGNFSKAQAQQSSGQVVNLMTVDSEKLGMLFYFTINILFVPVQIAILVWLLYETIGPAIFVGLGIIVVVLPITLFTMVFMSKFTQKKMITSDTRVKLTNELLQGIRFVKSYAYEYFFRDEVENLRSQEIEAIFGSNMSMMVMTFFFYILQPLVTVGTFLTYAALGNEFDPVVIFKAVAYLNALQQPLQQLPQNLGTIIMALISAGRIQAFLTLPELDRMQHIKVDGPIELYNQVQEDIKNGGDGKVPDNFKDVIPLSGEHSIVIENGSFAWSIPQLPPPPQKNQKTPPPPPKKDDKVIQNIDFKALRGKLTAIVGPVGCGKSSLVSAILEEMKMLEGSVQKDENAGVAYVAQTAWIQTMTVKENITFGREIDTPELEELYTKVIDCCALGPDLKTLDFGDQTEIGDRGVNLSGGQRQRISIARATFASPHTDIFLFDDPLSALDAHVSEHIFNHCITDTLKNKTRILVTNQLHFLARCDYIYVMGSNDLIEITDGEIDVEADAVLANNAAAIINSEPEPTPDSPNTDAPVEGAEAIELDEDNVKQVGIIVEHGTYTDLNKEGGVMFTMIQNYFSNLAKGEEENEPPMSLEDVFNAEAGGPIITDDITQHPDYDAYDERSHSYDDGDNPEFDMQDAEFPELSVMRSVTYSQSHTHTRSRAYENHQQLLRQQQKEQDRVHATRSAFVGNAKLKKGQQVTQEELNTGSVSFGVYLYHFATMGSIPFMLLTFFFFCAAQAAVVMLSMILSWWSSYKYSSNDDFYINWYGIILAISAVLLFARGSMYAYASTKSSKFYHQKLIHSVLRSTSSFFDTTPTGRILTRFSKDIDTIDSVIAPLFQFVVIMILTMIANMVTISVIQPWFLLAMAGLIVCFILIQNYYSPAAIQLQRLESNSRSPYIQHFAETLKGISTIRAFNMTSKFQYKQYQQYNINTSALFGVRIIYRWGGLRIGILQTLLILAVGLLTAGTRGTLSIGDAGVTMTFSLGFGNMIGFLVMLLIELASNMNSVERLRHYIYSLPSERDCDFGVDNFNPDEDWPSQGTIEYKDVSMRYRPELPLVLQNLSFYIPAGSKVGIVGRTGSGKSTLSLLMQCLYPKTEGSITIDDVDIDQVALHRLRRSIGVVPQDSVLFSSTIRVNLDPFNDYSDEAVLEALDAVNMKEFVLSLPNGIHHKVSEHGANFSIGQRQLFSICRVLLKNAKVLILDEATSSIDSDTDALIQNALNNRFKNTTKMIIAHRLNTIIDADIIIVLDHGRLVEFGTPKELIEANDTPNEYQKEGWKTNVRTCGIFASMYRSYIDNSKKSL